MDPTLVSVRINIPGATSGSIIGSGTVPASRAPDWRRPIAIDRTLTRATDATDRRRAVGDVVVRDPRVCSTAHGFGSRIWCRVWRRIGGGGLNSNRLRRMNCICRPLSICIWRMTSQMAIRPNGPVLMMRLLLQLPGRPPHCRPALVPSLPLPRAGQVLTNAAQQRPVLLDQSHPPTMLSQPQHHPERSQAPRLSSPSGMQLDWPLA
mmetsp:Transcript_30107/g.88060  ORF Transcript_30107/g.88060 Transcript_30107/m.88060 type:complete len:207 (-) Transcript_30107:3369-3989(-)